jgi:hypothetical protein
VRELYEREGGYDAWVEYGDTYEMAFYCTAESASWRILNAYLKRRGIVLE